MSLEERQAEPYLITPACASCAHYQGFGRCLAYDRIPSEILRNRVEHKSVLEGQTGQYVYEYGKPRQWLTITEK